jgi:hypothetical protein
MYEILVRNPQEKNKLGDLDVGGIFRKRFEQVGYIHMAQDRKL